MAAIGNRECPFRVGYAMLHETWDGESDVHGRGTRCGHKLPVTCAAGRPLTRLLCFATGHLIVARRALVQRPEGTSI
ncbi:hypothetical protein LMG28727_05316 [Paraburkholderia kirstenboschensis]|nr:hypothetical protein LMG28727_05316 [Paraburkholderia kirstenboschensis]